MDLLALFDDGFSLRWSLTLLHFLWQGSAVTLLAVLAGWLLRRASANARYAVNVLALAVMAACVPVTFMLLNVPAEDAAVAAVDEPVAPPAGSSTSAVAPSMEPPQASLLPAEEFIEAIPSHAGDSVPRGAPAAPTVADLNATSQEPQPVSSAKWVRVLKPASPYLMAFYLAGLSVMLLRLAMSLWGGARLRHAAIPIDEADLLAALLRQSRQLGLRAAPVAAWCGRVSMPVVIGVLQPMILLPASLATGLSATQLQALLAHELAHIRRFDLLVNLLQRLIEAALFFHPAVWFISGRVSIERENACDDAVLSAGWRPVEYADALVRMAEICTDERNVPALDSATLLAASGGSSSQFRRRVLRVLGKSDFPSLPLSPGGFTFVVLVLVSLTLTPAIVHSWADNNVGRVSKLPDGDADDEAKSGDRRSEGARGQQPRVQQLTAATFQPLGFLPDIAGYSWAYDVSGDGRVVVGNSRNERTGFRWTHEDGMTALPKLEGGVHHWAECASNDGTAIAGYCFHHPRPDEFSTAFLWTARDGIVSLGHLPGGTRPLTEDELLRLRGIPAITGEAPRHGTSRAHGISANGTTVVGGSTSKDGFQAFVWTKMTGMHGLGDLPGGEFMSCANGISADGQVIVGSAHSDRGYEAVRWINGKGPQSIRDLPGGRFNGSASAVSADGEVIVGTGETDKGYEAFRWTKAGMVSLGELPGGDHSSSASAVSADGSVVVGSSRTARHDEAFVWDAEHGMQNLRELLVKSSPKLAEQLEGWRLTEATGISGDGRVISGVGVNPEENWEAWIVTLNPVAMNEERQDKKPDLLDGVKSVPQIEPDVVSQHPGKLDLLAWTFDGKGLVGADFKTVMVWESGTGEALRKVEMPDGYANSLFASPSSPLVALGTNRCKVHLFSTRTLEQQSVFQIGPQYSIYAVAISPDDRLLASCAADGTVQVWDIMPQQRLLTLGKQGERMASLVFSPDGKVLATLSRYGRCDLWDVATGKRIGTVRGMDGDHNVVSFGPDGKTVVIAMPTQIMFWQPRRTDKPRVVRLPDAIDEGKQWEIWLRTLKDFNGNYQTFAGRLAVSPDLTTAASILRDGTIAVWDIATRAVKYRLTKTTPFEVTGGGVSAISFSPDGRRVAAGSHDGKVYVWQLPREENLDGRLPMKNDGQAKWSEPLQGMRVRLTASHGNEYRRGARLPLLAELQNVTDEPIRFADLHPHCDVRVYATTGEWLGVARTDVAISPWEGARGALAPKQTLQWRISLDLLRLNEPVTAGSTVQVRVSVPSQIEEPGKLPRMSYSQPVLVKLIHAPQVRGLRDSGNLPQLNARDMPDTWSEDMDVVYREVGGLFLRSCAIHIDGQGKVTMLNCGGTGRTETTLDRNRLNALAARLRQMKIWELSDVNWRLANPDEGEVRISLTYGAGTLLGDYANGLVRDNKTLAAFKAEMLAVIDEALKTVNKREVDNRGGSASEDAPKLGTLTGRFLFNGEPPTPQKLAIPTERRTLDNRSFPDPELARYNRLGLTDQSLIVGKDRGIKNVLVWIRSKGVPVAPREDQHEKPVLRLADGQFQPRVLAFQVPQTLVLKNEADHATNFHWLPHRSQPFNILVGPNQSREMTITIPDPLASSLKNNMHVWTKSWLFPCGHPYFAVSADDGTFAIENIPPGEWEFQVWHERAGYVRRAEWPKGRFTWKIEPGENDLGSIKFASELFNEEEQDERPERHESGATMGDSPAADGQLPDERKLSGKWYGEKDGTRVWLTVHPPVEQRNGIKWKIHTKGAAIGVGFRSEVDEKSGVINLWFDYSSKTEDGKYQLGSEMLGRLKNGEDDSLRVDILPTDRYPPDWMYKPMNDVVLHPLLQFRVAQSAPANELIEAVVVGTDEKVYMNKTASATARDVAAAKLSTDAQGNSAIQIDFTQDGAKTIATVTERNVGKRLAIVFEGNVVSAPTIRQVISSKAVITGKFSQETAKHMVNLLRTAKSTRKNGENKPDGTSEAGQKKGSSNSANSTGRIESGIDSPDLGATNLYQASVNLKNNNGRDFVISLRELQRQERHSIVQVEFTSGSSVGSSLWIAKGIYEIAKLRKEKYWVKLNEWVDDDGHGRYRIGYCSDRTVNPREYFGGEIDDDDELEFQSVEELRYLIDVAWPSEQ